MVSKNISITEDVYNDLLKLRKEDESFSEIIRRLVSERKKDPLRFYGILADVPSKDMDEFEDAIGRMKETSAKASNKKIQDEWG
jgi:predicted CopG family antitoxin